MEKKKIFQPKVVPNNQQVLCYTRNTPLFMNQNIKFLFLSLKMMCRHVPTRPIDSYAPAY